MRSRATTVWWQNAINLEQIFFRQVCSSLYSQIDNVSTPQWSRNLNELSYKDRSIYFISRDCKLSSVILVDDNIADVMRTLKQGSFTLIHRNSHKDGRKSLGFLDFQLLLLFFFIR